MKRSRFLVSLATTAAVSAAPRLAAAQSSTAAPRIVRRVSSRRVAVAGGCIDHSRKPRWAGFTANDFRD